jgi:uncharacterized protein (DUF169 family)
MKFDQQKTQLKIGSVLFEVTEPLTSHLTQVSKMKTADELTRALKVLELNCVVKEEGDKEFRPLTSQEIFDFPTAIITKLSNAIKEMTDGEYTVL